MKTDGPCLRLETGSFVAGLFYDPLTGRVTEAAPIIRWAIGKHYMDVLAQLHKRGSVYFTRFDPQRKDTMATQPAPQAQQPQKPKTFEEFLALCQRPTPARFVKQRQGWTDQGGRTHYVDYVEWHYVCDVLDWAWPRWQHGISEVKFLSDGTIYIVAWIEVDGVKREGIGSASPKGPSQQAGEMAFKSAESDALKRAATKFGIARDLYRKEPTSSAPPVDSGQSRASTAVARSASAPQARAAMPRSAAAPATRVAQSQPPAPRPAPQQSQSRGPANPNAPISVKQLGMIRAKSQELGLDDGYVARTYFEVEDAEGLTMGQASSLIDMLMNDPDTVYNAVAERGGALEAF